MKPQRVYEEMNKAFGRDTCYVSTIGLSQIAGAQFLHVYQAAQLDQLRPGRPARLDAPGGARRARRRSRPRDRRAVGRLRLPVHDRGTRRRRAVQAALHPRGGEQLLPRPDPPGAARLRHGLLRAARFENINAPELRRLRRRPRRGRRRPGLQGDPRHRPERCAGGVRAGARAG